ncbi:hypothetical protein M433DRAFT_164139 [Acidomyces richmondensis BFW]|nr:MAG: hypothetical protein FE78DRAFT_179794 [Acidomyces sp. 'richmondensis']KYG47657.1 hypothetical protein M433DRAFT_164139 [Acidomyces richmondensis BFW]
MVNFSNLHINLYKYTPSVGGSVFFILVFLGATTSHAWYSWYSRYKRFIPLIIGGLLEFIGYCIRAGAHNYLTAIGPFALQNLFLLLAPIFFAATIYMLLGTIIRTLNAEDLSPIRLSRLTKTFVTADVLCLIIQGNGGSLQAIDSSSIKINLQLIGKWVVVGGLTIQILTFGGFILICRRFHRRLLDHPISASISPSIQWEKCMKVLYVVSGLIVLRNLVRTIEYCQGFDGWIIQHEAMLFIFDAVPMSLLLLILLVWHPARLLGKNSNRSSVRSDMFNLRSGIELDKIWSRPEC